MVEGVTHKCKGPAVWPLKRLIKSACLLHPALVSGMTQHCCCECRASDDIEGELGRQIDSCMHSALSHCWGSLPIQSVTPKPVGSQAQSAYHSSHQQDGSQFHQEMMTKFGPDRQVRRGNTDRTPLGIQVSRLAIGC